MPGILNILVFVLANIILIQAKLDDPPIYYWGFSLEYTPNNGSGAAAIEKNLEEYEWQIQDVANDEFITRGDIIVFPEKGLTGVDEAANSFHFLVPSPEERVNPCASQNYEKVLTRLSCAASYYQIYLVVNLPEREECESTDDQCPERGSYQYNTNVVFDRNGTVIGRYRKFYLDEILDRDTDRPAEPQTTIFDTDFGVKFLVLTGQDFLYPIPAMDKIKSGEITDIVYTGAWPWTLPFKTAIQFYSGWQEVEKVTLIAAGLNIASVGCAGAGIYDASGLGLLTYGLYGAETRLGVRIEIQNKTTPQDSNVNEGLGRRYHVKNAKNYVYRNRNTKEEHYQRAEDNDGQLVIGRDDLTDFDSIEFVLKELTGVMEGNISSCSVRANYSRPDNNETYIYRLLSHKTDTCCLAFCQGHEMKDCTLSPPTVDDEVETVNFTDISVAMESGLDPEKDLLIPNTVYYPAFFPVFGATFQTERVGDITRARIDFPYLTTGVMTFGIYGKPFPRESN